MFPSSSRRSSRVASRFGPHRLSPLARLHLEALEDRAVPSVSWIGGSGDWSVGSNWSTGVKPTAADDVLVIAVPGVVVTHSTGTDAVHSISVSSGNTLSVTGGSLALGSASFINALTVSGGTLGGHGDVTIDGLFTWTGGTLGGTGTVTTSGTLALSGGNTKTLDGRTLMNLAAATWSDNGDFSLTNGAAVVNRPGATFTVQNDRTLNGNTTTTFTNAGTFIKTGSVATTTVRATFNNVNGGQVEVAVGDLTLTTGTGAAFSSFATDAGATLEFAGNYVAMPGSTVTGGGAVTFSGGTTTLLGTWSVTGHTTVSNGTAAFAANVTLADLTLSGGTLSGSGTVTDVGSFTWTGGTMNGGGTTVADDGIDINGPNGKAMDHRTLVNAVTAFWTGNGNISMGAGAVWNNPAGSALYAQNDATIGGSGSTFNNAGVLYKLAGIGTTTVAAYLNNSGTVDAVTGTVALTGGGLGTGVYFAEAGATLNFAGGTTRIGTGSFVGADGSIVLSGGTTAFDIDTTFSALTLSGGTLAGGATVTVMGLLTWTGGTLDGGGTLDAKGGIAISGSTDKAIAARIVNNEGTATWSGAGLIHINSDLAVWNNPSGSVFDVRTDANWGRDSIFNPQGTFNNYGTFRKSAGTGLTYGQITFNNNGVVDIESGMVNLAGGGISSGVFTVAAGTTLEFGGGAHYLTASSSLSGAGNVTFDSETFNGLSWTSAGTYHIDGTTTLQATNAPFAYPPVEFVGDATMGTLNLIAGTLSGVGTVTVTGALNWTGGTLSGSGTTSVGGTLTIGGTSAVALDGRTLINTTYAAWTGIGGISAGNGAVFLNQTGATFDAQSDANFTGNGTFENLGTFIKSAGTGTTTVGLSFVNNGGLTVATGRVALSAGLTNTGTVSIAAATTLTVNGTFLQTNGFTVLNGGSLTVTGGALVDIEGGILVGTGTITGDLLNASMVIVGSGTSTGVLTVTGNFTQTGAGSLEVSLGGTGAGQYDQLHVGGRATLDGTLVVSTVGGFTPAPGDSFAVLSFGSRTGDFALYYYTGPTLTASFSASALTLTA